MTAAPAGPVLVLGGTGHYGRRVVAALRRADAPARVVSRDATAARALLGEEVEVVAGDVRTAGVIERALDGARSVVVSLSAMTRKTARHARAIERDAVLRLFEQAPLHGVDRIVYISGYEIRVELLEELGILDVFGGKAEVEEALTRTGSNWTILGHSPSMEIYFAMMRGNTINVPGGGPPAMPTTAPDDAGAIIAQSALREDLAGQRFQITGPEALSFAQAAQRIGAVLGREIRARAIPMFPVRLVTGIAGIFNPFFRQLWASILLMNHFPADLAAAVPQAHARLVETFDYEPTTLEDETRRRLEAGQLR